jgi:hypothetical protein
MSLLPLHVTFGIIKDFLVKARTHPRLEAAHQHSPLNPLDLDLEELLAHVPLEDWPIPDRRQCPVNFCKEEIGIETLEEHLREKHYELWNKGGFHSEFHTSMVGLLGMELSHGDPHSWACPIPLCTNSYNSLRDISSHVLEAHGKGAQLLYDNVGGFWTTITYFLCNSFTNVQGPIPWPTIRDICSGREEDTYLDFLPVSFERARELWKPIELPDYQFYFQNLVLLDSSPLDNLLKKRRGHMFRFSPSIF